GDAMTRRTLTACLPLALLAAGCLDETRSRLVGGGPNPAAAVAQAQHRVMNAPGTEAAAKRVLEVGRQLVTANPKLGMRPIFITVGSPKPEVFHRGGGVEGYQVYVSDGLVDRCKDDAELAAVLAVELGKIVHEREAMSAVKAVEKPPSISESIGNDVAGTFGSPDGTHAMEMARYEQKRKKAGPPPPPDKLARQYLEQAGYQPGVVDDVAPILRQAEDNFVIEKHLDSGPPH
ncbi:MAG: M48 family metalloprotease, partial [Gemmataceae bacterium]